MECNREFIIFKRSSKNMKKYIKYNEFLQSKSIPPLSIFTFYSAFFHLQFSFHVNYFPLFFQLSPPPFPMFCSIEWVELCPRRCIVIQRGKFCWEEGIGTLCPSSNSQLVWQAILQRWVVEANSPGHCWKLFASIGIGIFYYLFAPYFHCPRPFLCGIFVLGL
jgi:hypothetical protein